MKIFFLILACLGTVGLSHLATVIGRGGFRGNLTPATEFSSTEVVAILAAVAITVALAVTVVEAIKAIGTVSLTETLTAAVAVTMATAIMVALAVTMAQATTLATSLGGNIVPNL